MVWQSLPRGTVPLHLLKKYILIMLQYLLDSLRGSPTKHIPDILNETFHNVDQRLSRMCEESDGKIHSGCTAVTAFLRVEDADGKQ